MGNENWKENIQKKLDERGIIAMESVGILTAKDVNTALGVIDRIEANRDETEEWRHIKKLQRERVKRVKGASLSEQKYPISN